MTRYRGLVLGWYHQRNAGDDRIAKCIEHWLSDHDLTFLSHTATPPNDVLQGVDYVLLGGGNIACGAHGAFKEMRRWISRAKVPVFGVGLGVTDLSNLKSELSSIPESGGALWVRDERSGDLTGCTKRDVFVGPDLSWLFPLNVGRRDPDNTYAVNFRPCEWREWNPEKWADALTETRAPLREWPLCFGKDADGPMLEKVLRKPSSAKEFDPTAPRRSACVIAMRFHAMVFSIQSGTPFVVVEHADKSDRFLAENGLSRFSVPIEYPERLSSTLELALREQSEQELQSISEQLNSQAWTIANDFRSRIESQADHARSRRQHFAVRFRRRIRRLARIS